MELLAPAVRGAVHKVPPVSLKTTLPVGCAGIAVVDTVAFRVSVVPMTGDGTVAVAVVVVGGLRRTIEPRAPVGSG
jgi:hypothetical protein